TGRVRDHWHTMTRTGKSQRLSAHRAVPFVEIHPDDAATHGLAEGDIARLSTEHGAAELEVTVTDTVVPGNLFMPMHWGGAFASQARVGALVRGMTDPVSGQPELKATPAAIASVGYRGRGFLLTRRQVAMPEGWWWARAAITGGWGAQFATADSSRAVALMVRGLIQSEALSGCELAEYADHTRNRYRCAVYDGDRLVACLAYAPAGERPDWEAAKALFATEVPDAAERRALLSGRAATASAGPVVCACHGVGADVIATTIAGGAASVEAVGSACKAGTNCGSCIPEIRKMLAGQTACAA
ncbi:MAG: nitrate reductase, partial [Methylobacterium sp.]|uniref:molybdopterin dinucleotide binding domain-containing protein n=1 Tax=Methylobacterium sp. TaxID=409 RepID=UPI000F90FC2E